MNKLTRFVVFLWERGKDDHRVHSFLWECAFIFGWVLFIVIGGFVGYQFEHHWLSSTLGVIVGGFVYPAILWVLFNIWENTEGVREVVKAAWQDASTKDKTE